MDWNTPKKVSVSKDGEASVTSKLPQLKPVTRRRFLELSAAGTIATLAHTQHALAATKGEIINAARYESSFDLDWLFHLGDLDGAQDPNVDDRGWRKLDLPHDWRIEDLPEATSDDGGATADPSVLATWTKAGIPRSIGPFSADADNALDLDVTYPGFGRIAIPGGRSQGYTVGGVAWYRKRFTVPKLAEMDDQLTEVRFDGVYRNCDVWLNGNHLGFHPNGYTAFAYDLSKHLNKDAENILAVRVDNRGKGSRWYTGSGIYRHTMLSITGPVRIPQWGVRVTTPVVDGSRSTAHAEVMVSNASTETTTSVRMTVLDAGGHKVAVETTSARPLEAKGTDTHSSDIAIPNTMLWSPETPHLYTLQTEILISGTVVDSVSTKFGVRSLVFDPMNGFSLNGISIKLHGGNIHHDHGPLGAVAIDRAEERTIELLKAAGFNCVRAAHNPRSTHMLDVCDRLGMLVYNEFSDVWDVKKTPDDYSVVFSEWWQRDLTSMITRDRNHPSVIIWSIGNEISEDPNKYGARLAAHVRSLDTTRPVVQGGMNVGKTPLAWEYSDLADFHGQPKASDRAAHPDKVFLQSEDLPTQIYDDWKFAQDSPWYIGSLVWSAWDYIGEAGAGPAIVAHTLPEATNPTLGLAPAMGKIPYPWFNNFQSDLDLIGRRKPQSYLRSVVNGVSPLELLVERPTPSGVQQFAVWYSYLDEQPSWNWDVPDGQLMTVHAYSSGDKVTLSLNGETLETKTLVESDKRIATFKVPYKFGTLSAVAFKNGAEIGRRVLATTGKPAGLKLTSDVSALTTSRGDLAHVLVQVIDAHGEIVPDAVVKVSFTVKGAGRLIGVGNGNAHNVDSFQRPRRWTWHGDALAILRPATFPGSLSITATAEGLKLAILRLPVSRSK